MFRIIRTKAVQYEILRDMIENALNKFDHVKILVSEGFQIDPQSVFYGLDLSRIRIQRILTSYQLSRILMESNNMAYFIMLRSEVMDEWEYETVDSIQWIIRMKSLYSGNIIFLNVVGSPSVMEKFFDSRIPTRFIKGGSGLIWEELFPA
ncbi:hypothetical protein [Caldiplasma sukawensis]